ncbi:MAG: fumarate reductase/succinate dehydrogenase flavoprotein domain protein [Rhodospirillales bacterium]|nr:fumarate reductase/succinate dehydrogenase flavoprotein domain protein [Rhodospirillales bacterium]
MDTLNIDFLVFGGGMAGMTAAAKVASKGRIVLVVEKAAEIGGSTVLSGGKLWTAKSMELFEQETPGGDPALRRAVFDMFDEAVAWLRSTGVTVADVTYHLHYGKGYDFDVVGYIDYCRRVVEQAGGTVIRGATADRLIVRDGGVEGAVVVDRDGETIVHAPWTLLATGGFSANPQLLECFVHRRGGSALARSNPHSTGDGMRLGLGAGAALSPFMKGFYGHVIQSPVNQWGPREFRTYTQGGSIKGIMINQQGARFCDESLGDHQNAQRILEQPQARAAILFDEAVRREEARTILAGTDTPIDKVSIAMNEGARVAVGDTWEQVFETVETWGFAREPGLATILAYNATASAGNRQTHPSRVRELRAYDTPPFYAIEGQTGVTATHGGLRVDAQARVLNSGSQPVRGLLAAGADAGNIYGEGYAGGLAAGATFALLAAQQVIGDERTI